MALYSASCWLVVGLTSHGGGLAQRFSHIASSNPPPAALSGKIVTSLPVSEVMSSHLCQCHHIFVNAVMLWCLSENRMVKMASTIECFCLNTRVSTLLKNENDWHMDRKIWIFSPTQQLLRLLLQSFPKLSEQSWFAKGSEKNQENPGRYTIGPWFCGEDGGGGNNSEPFSLWKNGLRFKSLPCHGSRLTYFMGVGGGLWG